VVVGWGGGGDGGGGGFYGGALGEDEKGIKKESVDNGGEKRSTE